MWHLVFVSLHAAFATAAFVAGLVAIVLPRLPVEFRRTVVRVHMVGIVGMSGSLPFSLAAGWADFAEPARPVFLGLFVLSLYMLRRAVKAMHAWSRGENRTMVDHVGFNLIALTIGFTAVAVVRADLGIAAVIAAVAISLLAGHLVIRALRARSDEWATVAGVAPSGDSERAPGRATLGKG